MEARGGCLHHGPAWGSLLTLQVSGNFMEPRTIEAAWVWRAGESGMATAPFGRSPALRFAHPQDGTIAPPPGLLQ